MEKTKRPSVKVGRLRSILSVPASDALKEACRRKAAQEGMPLATWARRELAKATGIPLSQT